MGTCKGFQALQKRHQVEDPSREVTKLKVLQGSAWISTYLTLELQTTQSDGPAASGKAILQSRHGIFDYIALAERVAHKLSITPKFPNLQIRHSRFQP